MKKYLILILTISLFLISCSNDIRKKNGVYIYNNQEYYLNNNKDFSFRGELNTLYTKLFSHSVNSLKNDIDTNIIVESNSWDYYTIKDFTYPDLSDCIFKFILLEKRIYLSTHLFNPVQVNYDYYSLVYEFSDCVLLNEIDMLKGEITYIDSQKAEFVYNIVMPIENISYLNYVYGTLMKVNNELYIEHNGKIYIVNEFFKGYLNEAYNEMCILEKEYYYEDN